MKVLPIILRVVIAAVLMFAASFSGVLMQFVPGYESILAGTAVGRSTTGLLLACGAMLMQFACATAVAYVGVRLLIRYLDHQPPTMLKLRPTKTGMLWFAAMIGVAMVILLIAGGVTILLGTTGEPLAQHGDQWWATLIIVLGMAFLLQGIPEELVWRGWLLPSLGGKNNHALVRGPERDRVRRPPPHVERRAKQRRRTRHLPGHAARVRLRRCHGQARRQLHLGRHWGARRIPHRHAVRQRTPHQ